MKTAYEKFLEDKIKVLESELTHYHKEKRSDLVEAEFIKYETWNPPFQHHNIPRVIKGSPKGYEHGETYLIPEENLQYPWWRRKR